MTDKEQQIEEMNSIMQEAYNDHCENVSCVKCPYFGMQHGKNEEMSTFCCQNYLEATTLYNAGYRKVDEKFCLKHSEKDYCLTEEDAKGEKACEDCREKVRKGKAKEILQELYDEANGMNNKTVELSAHYIKNTLAKGCGVEID